VGLIQCRSARCLSFNIDLFSYNSLSRTKDATHTLSYKLACRSAVGILIALAF
jgi:hypothetical protein